MGKSKQQHLNTILYIIATHKTQITTEKNMLHQRYIGKVNTTKLVSAFEIMLGKDAKHSNL